MEVEFRELGEQEMPEGHDWAVVHLDGAVWLLVRPQAPTLNGVLIEALSA